MKKCPICNQEWANQSFCPTHGERLYPPVVGGIYRLDKRIGTGGMGDVYLARRIGRHNDRVAVKVLHADLVSDPVAVERFRREAQATIAIDHPNVVKVYDFDADVENGVVFIAMEYLDGESLTRRIARQGRIGIVELARILHYVAQGLHAAHERGIIHRDLKPDNIFISRRELALTEEDLEQVRVLDFGIAKLKGLSRLTGDGTVMGTPDYMSPEQCKGLELDPRSDVYSLGVILYEALVGQPPFFAATAVAVALMHVKDRPTPPSLLRPDVPLVIEAIIMRSLSKDPEERQQTVLDLAAEFRSAADELNTP